MLLTQLTTTAAYDVELTPVGLGILLVILLLFLSTFLLLFFLVLTRCLCSEKEEEVQECCTCGLPQSVTEKEVQLQALGSQESAATETREVLLTDTACMFEPTESEEERGWLEWRARKEKRSKETKGEEKASEEKGDGVPECLEKPFAEEKEAVKGNVRKRIV